MNKLRQQILNIINEAEYLPLEAKMYIIKDIYRDLVDIIEKAETEIKVSEDSNKISNIDCEENSVLKEK